MAFRKKTYRKKSTRLKAIPKKPSNRPLKLRTRNAGTMTDAMFWHYIRGVLRGQFRWWEPVALCKLAARRKYLGRPLLIGKKLQMYEFKCAHCQGWFPEKLINVDHIIEAGSINCADDAGSFIERLFCEVEGLQVLCVKCHSKKTKTTRDGNCNHLPV